VQIHRLSVEMEAPSGRPDEAGEDFHKRRFPRAVVAQQAQHLALVDVHRDIGQRRHLAEAFRDMLPAQQFARHRQPP